MVEGYDGAAVQKIKTTEWHFNSQTLKVLLIDVFFPHFLHRLTIIQCVYDLRSFPSMWHPRMQLSSWRAPSYVPLSSSLCCSKWYFSHSKLVLFFSGLHQGTPSVAVAVQLQNPETLLLWETDPAEGKTGSSTTQHNRFYRTRRHHATVLTVVIFDMFLLIAACKWIVHLTPSWRRGLHADHSNNGTEGKLPWPASLCTLP